MDFYLILQEIMNEQDLSLRSVAQICDVPEATLRSIFHRQQKRVALDIAFKIHRYLDVPLERLNGEPVDEKPPVHPRKRKDDPRMKVIFDKYSEMTDEGKEKVTAYVNDIHALKKYRKK